MFATFHKKYWLLSTAGCHVQFKISTLNHKINNLPHATFHQTFPPSQTYFVHPVRPVTPQVSVHELSATLPHHPLFVTASNLLLLDSSRDSLLSTCIFCPPVNHLQMYPDSHQTLALYKLFTYTLTHVLYINGGNLCHNEDMLLTGDRLNSYHIFAAEISDKCKVVGIVDVSVAHKQ